MNEVGSEAGIFAGLPQRGAYRVIYADPPWSFETWSHRGQGKGASQHYATQGMDWLKSLPVGDLAAPDAALFLWVVQPMLPEALELIRAWGFVYKTVGYVWVKTKTAPGEMLFFDEAWAPGLTKMGLGYHTRSGAEQCWLATRGKGYARLSKGEAQVVHAPLREHSRKPDAIAESILRLAGGPHLELFARTSRPGWDVWGNETAKFAAHENIESVRVPAGRSSLPAAGPRDAEGGERKYPDSAPAVSSVAPVAAPGIDARDDDDLLAIPAWLKRDAFGRLAVSP